MCSVKICTKCSIEKPIEEFPKRKEAPDGRRGLCKVCYNLGKNKNLKQRATLDKILPENNLKICCTCKLEKSINEFSKKSDTKDGLMRRCKQCTSKHHQKTKENIKLTQKNYYESNKSSIRSYKNRWFKNKRDSDTLFLLITNLRSSIRSSLKRKRVSKTNKTLEILSCSFEDFKTYIEKQFLPWMTWDNYGLYNGELNYGWDLDHIIPISSATTEGEVYLLNHWSNFQPLCSKVNRDTKKANIIG